MNCMYCDAHIWVFFYVQFFFYKLYFISKCKIIILFIILSNDHYN